jgi:predicted transcriptional regulator
MHVIWEPGVTKAREVREELPDGRHYNSVLTIIRMLKRKGRLIHRVAGKADIYRAQQPEKSHGRVLPKIAAIHKSS